MESLDREELIQRCKNLLGIAKKAKQAKDGQLLTFFQIDLVNASNYILLKLFRLPNENRRIERKTSRMQYTKTSGQRMFENYASDGK